MARFACNINWKLDNISVAISDGYGNLFKLDCLQKTMLSMKIHESYRKVVALCDSDLVGKKFEEGKMQLDVRENFYKEEEIDEEKAVEILRDMIMEDATFNIVGERAVGVGVKVGLISGESVGKVSGVPFALSLL